MRDRLVHLGVAPATAAEALAAELPEAQQERVAQALARKRLAHLRRGEREAIRSRLHAFLLRRGFDHDVVARTVDSVLGDSDE